MLKILIAPNGFKESMSAAEAARSVALGIKDVVAKVKIIEMPLADGGSGTVQAIINSAGGRILSVRVLNPVGRPITARYGMLPKGRTAVIEMAASSGLSLITREERNPMLTSSYGAGQLISRAVKQGARRIIIGIGDTATVDGGIGALQALGVKILDAKGDPVGEGGEALQRIASVDLQKVDPKLFEIEFLIASDVENPLLGEMGAACVFGPQKGASPAMVRKLEQGLARWDKALTKATGKSFADYPGSGAAGGFATGFLALFGAKITPGSLLIFNYGKIEEKISAADLIFTAEGAIDHQTLLGKTPARLAAAAKRTGKPIIVFAARIDIEDAKLAEHGFCAAIPIVDRVATLAEACARGPQLLRSAAARTMRLLLLNNGIKRSAK